MARNLLKLEIFKEHFTMETWEYYESRLKNHAKELSYKFGYLNKHPGKQIHILKSDIDRLEHMESQTMTTENGADMRIARELRLKRNQLQEMREILKADQERVAGRHLSPEQINEDKPRSWKKRERLIMTLQRNPDNGNPVIADSTSSTLNIVAKYFQNAVDRKWNYS
jgi:hypothetical protein